MYVCLDLGTLYIYRYKQDTCRSRGRDVKVSRDRVSYNTVYKYRHMTYVKCMQIHVSM